MALRTRFESTCGMRSLSHSPGRSPSVVNRSFGWFESVVVRKRRFRRPTMPFSRMRRAIRFLLTRMPRLRSARSIRGLP